MPEESFQERTEQATPKRRQEAREKGQVPKSRELASVAVLMSGLLTLFWGSAYFYGHTANIMRFYLGQALGMEITKGNVNGLALLVLKQLSITLAPLMLVLTLVAIISNYLQVGTVFSWEAIAPKMSKISPLSGLKRLFSAQAFAEFVKSLLKLVIVTWIAYVTVKGEMNNLVPLLDQSPEQIFTYLGRVSFLIFWRTCLVMVFLAILDYLFQRWEHEKNLKMTKQEVKEEYKQTEGDPQVKARIKQEMQQQAFRTWVEGVKKELGVTVVDPRYQRHGMIRRGRP